MGDPEAGGHAQEPGDELTSPFRLHAQTQLETNHRWSEGPFRGVVGGFHIGMGQEGPQCREIFQQGPAGAHRSGQWRGFTGADAQVHRPLQLGLESLAYACGGGLQRRAADAPVPPGVPVGKHVLLEGEQLLADLAGDAGWRLFDPRLWATKERAHYWAETRCRYRQKHQSFEGGLR